MSNLNVLVVDDSALMRNLVSRIVESAPDMGVVGTAMNGEFALSKIERLDPDAIVLDLEMPTMNGIEFLKERSARGITIPVIILSSIATKGAAVTMEALSLGASDFITKPSGSVSHDIHTVADQLIAMLRGYGTAFRREQGKAGPQSPENHAVEPRSGGTLSHQELEEALRKASSGDRTSELRTKASVRPAERQRPPLRPIAAPASSAPARTPKAEPGRLEIIVLGISTGGPNALRKVLAEIDGEIGVPIVVVQHMPAGFTTEFAQSLNRISPLEVKEAAEGDILKANRVLIAPGNFHIEVERRSLAGIVHINQHDPQNGHRPSAGVLFTSAAKHYGRGAMAVIMTGMGRDGANELGEIYEAGGMTIGQDEASSVVYGMPRVAHENGYVHQQVSLADMATTISSEAARLRA